MRPLPGEGRGGWERGGGGRGRVKRPRGPLLPHLDRKGAPSSPSPSLSTYSRVKTMIWDHYCSPVAPAGRIYAKVVRVSTAVPTLLPVWISPLALRAAAGGGDRVAAAKGGGHVRRRRGCDHGR
jgi:hypothetical protein